ncbi:hypothetical protein Srot_2302 [Segniliparus rotundus DSM 44985]|uniref:Uncharacterized protein n=1 Tax=Segniliparus rotundus (strain ATCC BAA-972 / CDC 1076 / CIP 108378 / DSM 44985 / JCM 13578) TaxID=640132 RepID=D6ZAL6_SEGRD|nr:hypothetical protein Srot_2302 [Segniliparus rotundus DSM 44985]
MRWLNWQFVRRERGGLTAVWAAAHAKDITGFGGWRSCALRGA